MTRLKTVKTNFTGGALAPDLLGRGDLRAYENGARTLDNVIVLPTGGLARRPGTAFVAAAPGPGRLVLFSFSTDQAHLLLFTDGQVQVFRDDGLEATLPTPWTLAQLKDLTWTQSADVLLLCHPQVPPQRLARTGPGAWTLSPWVFAAEDGKSRIPYFRFGDLSVTLTPSARSGRVRVKASAPVFQPGHDGQPLRIHRKPCRFAAILSPTLAEVDVFETLPDTDPTVDWDEAAFSPVRGWPVSACFHQDRLVVGGSRDLPNRLWLSRSGDLFNFDLGEGEDDEAIEFAILSDEVNPIRAVFSGRHLQVFTTGAEWAVTGEPLTPQAIRLDRQTRLGSRGDRQIGPREVDGATLFAAADGSLREFFWTDAERVYQAGDLTVAARHIAGQTVEMDHDRRRRLLLAVQADGTVAALTLYRAEQVSAWTRLVTAGQVLSLAVVGDTPYWLVRRDGAVWLEAWDDGFQVDAGISGTAPAPTARWSGAGHLAGRTATVLGDGIVLAPSSVKAGRLRLDRAVRAIQAGLPFTHRVEPLPANLLAAEGQGAKARLLAVTFRLKDTPVLKADLGRGALEVPLRRTGGLVLTEAPAVPFTGDRRLTTLGWPADPLKPAWSLADDRPLPFTLLAATHEMKVND